jgi:hypothetical protein
MGMLGDYSLGEVNQKDEARYNRSMSKFRWYCKFAWLYTTSMFLPTAIITPRIEKAVKEYEADMARQKA